MIFLINLKLSFLRVLVPRMIRNLSWELISLLFANKLSIKINNKYFQTLIGM